MASFCIMSDTRSQGQHEAILYNVRYTYHKSNMDPFCIMSDTQITSPTWRHSVNVRYTWTRDLCIWNFTEWRHVGLVICVSDILQDDAMLDSWSVSDIIHDDAMLDSWPMYLTLYRMMLDLWSVYLTFTEWHHVGLVSCVSDIIQDDAMLDSWSVSDII